MKTIRILLLMALAGGLSACTPSQGHPAGVGFLPPTGASAGLARRHVSSDNGSGGPVAHQTDNGSGGPVAQQASDNGSGGPVAHQTTDNGSGGPVAHQ